MSNSTSTPAPAGTSTPAASYTITIGSSQENLLAPLTLPAATIVNNGWMQTLTGTSGNDVFEPGQGGGTVTMTGNGGNDVFYVHGFNDVVAAKAGGIDTVITDFGWGSYTLPANVTNLIYDGTASYNIGWITLTGNTLNDTIVANNLGDKLVAGTGNDILVGGTGPDIFVVAAGDGNDTVINFHGGSASTTDTVQLQNLGFTTFAGVQAAMKQSGANVVLTLPGGHTLTFVGQQIGGFTAAEFGLPPGSALVASAPSLAVSAASGIENAAVALSIAASLVNPVAGETLAITITGVPTGATLSAGTLNNNGSWSLTTAQLAGLTLTPPSGSTTPFTLSVTATAAETNGSTASASQSLAVTLGPAAVAPNLTVAAANPVGTAPIALTITAALVSPTAGETLAITITGVPTGGTLSAGNVSNTGTWSLTSAQLAGLTLTPPAGWTAPITLGVTATATEADGSTATASQSLSVATAAQNYTITIGSAQESLLSPLTLPAATIVNDGWMQTLTGTAGNDVFEPGISSGGTVTMNGNSGNDVFYVHGFNDNVVAGAGGIDTVITDISGGGYTLPGNVTNLIYDGTGSYASGWITLTGNTMNDTIVANNLGDKLMAGSGNDILVGGTGPDIFVVAAGDGNNTIVNFHGGSASTTDTVQLLNLGFTSFSGVQSYMTQSGNNTVLNLGTGETLTFVGQQVANFTAAEFGLGSPSGTGGDRGGGGSGGDGGGGTPGTTVVDPSIVQPAVAGQVVGFMLRNNGATALGAHEVSFGETFTEGEVPAGSQLVATIGGQQVAVQMTVLTTNADGSVAMAELTLLQPALAANASVNGMLSLAAASTSQPPIALAALTPSVYSVQVNLVLHNADGSNTTYALDSGSLLRQALAAGTATIEQQGSQVTEAQFKVPISGSFYLTFDVSLFADGSTATDVSFNNDIAMAATGGTVNYDATIVQNGTTVLQQSNITQYQYQTWNQEIYSNGAPQAQVVEDIAALERTGAIPNYDTSAGVSTLTIAAEGSQLGGAAYGILGSASVTQYMPTTGGRDDIGPQPAWNAIWLMTQDPTAEAYALAQANAAGSVPWHFYNAVSGNYLTVTQYPNLWTDPRALGEPTYTPLTQQVSASTGWTPDTAHQPDLSYVAYLMTGNQVYLDQLNAQASNAEASDWTAYRMNGQGLVANGLDQVRGQAWSLREIDEAAFANPNGSAMKAYFTQMENANWSWLVSQIPTWTAAEGAAYGWVPGNYGGSASIAPWEQDYFVSTAVQAAELGNQNALTFLNWESNFIVGRFLNAANGFYPQDGIVYNLTVLSTSGTPLPTWAAIEQASTANGQTNGSGWLQSNGDYGQLALQSLAGIITVTESTNAMQAYGWLLASGAPQLNTDTQFDIVPRLSDGQLLSLSNVIISTDTTATTLQGTNSDQLIHAGSGNDTIHGGSGINLLFAGSGNDVLIGGSNSDYLFAGGGSDTLSGGAGSNFMQAGSGPDAFNFSASDIASDIIAGFKLGTDRLVIAGNGPTSALVGNVLSTMTQDAAGDAVLHLSSSHSVTLLGIGETHVTTALFG